MIATKPAQSEGVRPKVPAWLAAEGIKEGEFLIETKPRFRKIQKSRAWDPKSRVFMNLSLHTMGFQQKLAVKQVKGGAIVPLAPQDIANETGLDPKHVRKILRRLRVEGFCHIEGLRKGEIRIYAYAIPRAGVAEDLGVSTDPQIPDGMPPQVFRRLRYFGLKLPKDFKAVNGCLPDILGVLADCQNGFAGVRNDSQTRLLGVCGEHAYKEERKEEKDISISEQESSSSALCSLVETAEEEEPQPEEKISPKPADRIKEVREAYPEGHWDDAKATESYGQTIKSAAEHKKLLEGLGRHKQSERWLDNAGYWIPLASNFISKRLYNYDPPPKLTTGKARAAPYTIFDMIREGGTS